MKFLPWIVVTSLSVITLASSENVFASNRAGAVALSLGTGQYYFSSKQPIDNAIIPFGELAYDLSPNWGVEATLGFFTTDSNRPEDNGSQVNGTLFAMDAIYHFRIMEALEPFIMLGPGAISMHPNGNDANTEGNVNGGIGLQYFFAKSIALRIEARDFYTIVGGKNDYFLDGGVSFLFDLV